VIKKILTRSRPADFLNVSFLIFLDSVVFIFHREMRASSLLITIYTALIFLQALLIYYKNRSAFSSWAYDLIFPTICVLVVFDSLGRIVHSVNPVDIDPFLIKLDYMLFDGNPTVMMERITRPFLTDILQLAYASYYFLPIAIGAALKLKKNAHAFDRCLFFILLCFYLSYVGYLLWPALGPRFTINHAAELKGFILADTIRGLLNSLEGIKRDAFPSGHTGVALTVLYLTFRFEKRLFGIFLPLVLTLIFSTVYLRYHYVVDVMAGALLALITIILGEMYYGFRPERVDINR
jgi:membrane-associated phospholipid phosphatase